MKNNDFKAIHVFNYLISIQLPLKITHIDIKWKNPRLIDESPLSP